MARAIKVRKRGTRVLPAKVRRRFGIAVVPIEIYTPGRKAEFLLSNAVDEKDYRAAKNEVQRMVLDTKEVRHKKPRRE